MSRAIVWAAASCLLVLYPGLAAAKDGSDFFRLPSFVSAQGGLGKNSYQDSALNVGISLPGNWQIDFGGDRTSTESSDVPGETIVTRGYHLGAGTDPLNLFSGRILAEGWELDNVQARGGRVGLTYAPGLWTFSVEWISQTLLFTNLPPLVYENGQATVKDSGFSVRVSTMAIKNWNFFISGTGHTYDKDLSRLYEIPALILNRIPSTVLTALTGLNKSDASLGATYMFKKWDVGAEAGRSISAVDGVKTRRFGVNAMYYLNRNWSFGISTMTFRPEDAEENSDATHSSLAIVTYKFR